MLKVKWRSFFVCLFVFLFFVNTLHCEESLTLHCGILILGLLFSAQSTFLIVCNAKYWLFHELYSAKGNEPLLFFMTLNLFFIKIKSKHSTNEPSIVLISHCPIAKTTNNEVIDAGKEKRWKKKRGVSPMWMCMRKTPPEPHHLSFMRFLRRPRY